MNSGGRWPEEVVGRPVAHTAPLLCILREKGLVQLLVYKSIVWAVESIGCYNRQSVCMYNNLVQNFALGREGKGKTGERRKALLSMIVVGPCGANGKKIGRNKKGNFKGKKKRRDERKVREKKAA